MAGEVALTWDGTGEKYYHTGVDMGALYILGSDGTYETGVAWNGLTKVADNPQGGDRTELWADNIMYAAMTARETAGGSISCYTYPDEFEQCLGHASPTPGAYLGQQTRKKFGFAYRSLVGNDVDEEAGEIIHVYYGCSASPSSQDHSTINDNPDAAEFSFDFEATPVAYTGYKPTATLEFDSRKFTGGKTDAKFVAVKDKLFGKANTNNATLPDPATLVGLATP